MKKLLALVLSLVLTVALCAGCGGNTSSDYSDNGEDVTLTIAIPVAEQKDTQEVVAAINEKLTDLLPNTKIELLLDANMADKWSLWMSTKKNIDIAHSGYCTDLEQEVINESYLELNDLVDEYAPNIKELMKEYWYSYDNATINGSMYAIPNIQYYTKETVNLKIKKGFDTYLDIAALIKSSYSSRKTKSEFYDILTAALAKAEAAGEPYEVSPTYMYGMAKRGYVFIGGEDSNICYSDDVDNKEIIDFYTTKEFSDFCSYMKQWADKGWISPDTLTDTGYGCINLADGFRYTMDEATGNIPLLEGETYYTYNLNDPDKDVVLTNIGENATYYSIPFSSKNPVRAIKFLDLINSEEGSEILNLLAYGIEGKHWEFVDKENGDIKAFEYQGQGSASVSYGIPNWECANMMLVYNVAPYTHEFKEYGKKYYLEHLNELDKHILYGYTFDTSEVRTNLSNILKNNAEYAKSIYCGVVENSAALLDELNNKNKAAGISDVIKEFQKQADDYVASK